MRRHHPTVSNQQPSKLPVPDRPDGFGMAQEVGVLFRRQWFASTIRAEDQPHLTPLLFAIYACYGSGQMLTKRDAMYEMQVRDPRTAQRFTQVAKEAGLLDVVQSHVDRRVDYLVPTQKLLRVVERELGELAVEMERLLQRRQGWSVGQVTLGQLGVPNNRNDLKRSLERSSEAIKLLPKNPAAFQRRALVYWWLGRSVEALNDCTRAIELDQTDPSLFELRAEMHEQLGDYEAAVVDLDSLIALAPIPSSFLQRGRFFDARGRYDDAVEDFTRALELEQQNKNSPYDLVHYLVLRGLVLRKLWKHDVAEADLRAARTLDSEFAESMLGAERRRSGVL